MTDDGAGEWDDLLGTGTVMKQVLVRGRSWQESDEDEEGVNMEAPRKFFALIDIETRLHNSVTKEPIPVESECHRNFLINSDADLFAGAHLVIPLMDIHETSRYIFDTKFAYGSLGNQPHVPSNCRLDCIITLKVRSAYDEFLNQLKACERLAIASRKKERGKFWFARGDYHMAISMYQSMTDLCRLDGNPEEPEDLASTYREQGGDDSAFNDELDDGAGDDDDDDDDDDEYELARES